MRRNCLRRRAVMLTRLGRPEATAAEETKAGAWSVVDGGEGSEDGEAAVVGVDGRSDGNDADEDAAAAAMPGSIGGGLIGASPTGSFSSLPLTGDASLGGSPNSPRRTVALAARWAAAASAFCTFASGSKSAATSTSGLCARPAGSESPEEEVGEG